MKIHTLCLGCAKETATGLYCDSCMADLKAQALASREKTIQVGLAKAGVPSHYLGVRLTPEQLDFLHPYVHDSGKPGVLLYGPPGVGKTHLAAGLAIQELQAAMGKGLVSPRGDWWRNVLFVRADVALRRIRSGIEDGTDVLEIAKLGNTPYLVIDDFGAEKTSEWVGQVWHSMLDERLNKGLATVITTNFNGAELAACYGAWGLPIQSRLRGLCAPIALKGKDRRA